jgi:tRNA modification GTPase
MDTSSVIVAIASAAGPSARGIVRLSGAGCWEVLSGVMNDTPPRARGVYHARLTSPAPHCPCLVITTPGPASSTGEDCAELHLTGNPYLLEQTVHAIVHASGGAARRAGPGEFSARAVLLGRQTLEQVQRVAAAVAAETQAQLSAANDLRTRRAGLSTERAADQVANLLALVEAGIDFTDQEDVSAIAPADLAQQAAGLAAELRSAVHASAGSESLLAAPLAILAGPPNAGKSSLFNALLGRSRAVASRQVGSTRDVIVEPLELSEGITMMLADAPGLREADSPLDVLVQQRAEEALASADLVLWCTPAGQKAEPPPPVRGAVIHVTTMCDLAPGMTERTPSVHTAVRTSATRGQGLTQLRTELEVAWNHRTSTRGAQRVDVIGLHRLLAEQAAQALEDAAQLAGQAAPNARQFASPELVAATLRVALDRLGEVAGAIPPDDVLGRLFSKFCVGK